MIECPRMLFPFAREIISGATADGGFYPPFQLDPIDFAAIYIARQQQIALDQIGEAEVRIAGENLFDLDQRGVKAVIADFNQCLDQC